MNNQNFKNGYILVDNGFIDAVIKAKKIFGYKFSILFTILKYTAGFSENSAYLSLNDIAKETGIDRRYVWKILKELEKNNMIEWKKGKSIKAKSEFKIKT